MAEVRKGFGVVHSVHFYDSDRALIQRLQSIFMSAFEIGNSVIIVATEEHYRQLSAALKRQIIDVVGLEAAGRLIFFEASEALEHFMVNGMPDRELFYNSIGRLLREAKCAASNSEMGLTSLEKWSRCFGMKEIARARLRSKLSGTSCYRKAPFTCTVRIHVPCSRTKARQLRCRQSARAIRMSWATPQHSASQINASPPAVGCALLFHLPLVR